MTPEQEILQDALIAARSRANSFATEIAHHGVRLPLDPDANWASPSAALETEMAAFTKRYEMTQDLVTRRLFRSILAVGGTKLRTRSLAEAVAAVAALGIVRDTAQWEEITDLRNSFAHDYALTFAEIVPLLNQAWSFAPVLIATIERAAAYVADHNLLGNLNSQ